MLVNTISTIISNAFKKIHLKKKVYGMSERDIQDDKSMPTLHRGKPQLLFCIPNIQFLKLQFLSTFDQVQSPYEYIIFVHTQSRPHDL